MPSHHLPGGGFRNPWPGVEEHGFADAMRWMLGRRLSARAVDPPASAFARAAPAFDAPRAAPEALTATWVGHSTVLLQIGGRNVLTDPMWGARASPLGFAGPRRWMPPGIDFRALPPIDLVVLSHNHYDHLDEPTVRALARSVPDAEWAVPLGLADFVRRRGARRVHELDWWDEVTAAGHLTLACTPAQHFSARGLGDRNRTLWASWCLAAPGARVFFGGDTGYHPEFATIGARHGPFDLALLPVGAYDPRWFMRPVHMDPEEAVRAFVDLRAAHPGRRGAMLPIHWGTFKLTDEAMDEPPRRARTAWAAAGLDPSALWLLRHGETRRR